MELQENRTTLEKARQCPNRRGRLLHRRSKTYHSLRAQCKTQIKNREEFSMTGDGSHNSRTRPASWITAAECKPRPNTATTSLRRPTIASDSKLHCTKFGRTEDDFHVISNELSLDNYFKQNHEERRDIYSSITGRRRRISSASHTRSRNTSSGSLDQIVPVRSRSGSKTTLSRVPGLIKISSSVDMKNFREVENDDDEEERRKKLKEKFRRAVRLVSIFSAFCIGIKKFAEQEKSGEYDMYYLRDMLPGNEDKPTPVQESSLYFNKHLFSRDNTLHFPLWARWTCALAPSDRTDAAINKLVTLLRGIKSFNKFSREAQWQLCRTMTYARYEKRRIIIRQGHPGFCFYFIVSGTVSVTVTRKDFKTGISLTNTVDVLEKNDAFGEIALITKDACRTATIICRERVEVLVLNRETVMEHCPDVFHNEFQEKMNILKEHVLFRRWDEPLLKALCLESHIKELAHGKLVDSDTTASEAVHFILRLKYNGSSNGQSMEVQISTGKVDMLRCLDMCAVIASNASISLCETLPLPRPTSAIPRKGERNMEFVSVGSLYKNDAWDLRTIFPSGYEESGNILVSAGVRLLKVPKERITQLSPNGALEEFEKNFVQNHRCPTNEELYQEYLSSQAWLEYRQKVVKNVIDCKNKQFIAHASCVSKGSSGWGPWPKKEIRAVDHKEERVQRILK